MPKEKPSMCPSVISVCISFLLLCCSASAIRCTGIISNTVIGNLEVPTGATCTIDGVVVYGGVSVREGARLITSGATSIQGSLRGIGYSNIAIGGTTFITEFISLRNSQGNATFCGTNIGGDVIVTGGSGIVVLGKLFACPPCKISGKMTVSGGSGNVRLIRSKVVGIFSATARVGTVVLRDVTIEAAVSITNMLGPNVNLRGSTFLSTVLVQGCKIVNANVNRFSGTLQFMRNTGLVDFTDSKAQAVIISRNTGGVKIAGNTIMSLRCAKNRPKPTGSGNIVQNGFGQCRSF